MYQISSLRATESAQCCGRDEIRGEIVLCGYVLSDTYIVCYIQCRKETVYVLS